jgi:hypothetical protein
MIRLRMEEMRHMMGKSQQTRAVPNKISRGAAIWNKIANIYIYNSPRSSYASFWRVPSLILV